MILEALVTTRNEDGTTNIAPMGPRIVQGMDRFVLRPFRTSTTYRNLQARPEGVLHVTDDALLIARTAIGQDASDTPMRPAERVVGAVLLGACRFFEFRVAAVDEREVRASFEAKTVHRGTLRDYFGFNRAKHAVIEAAILATRTEWLLFSEIQAEYNKFAEVVRKTGGPEEHLALRLLSDHVGAIARGRGFSWKDIEL